MKLGAVVLDSDNSKALAGFYQRLLGWTECRDDGEYIYLSDGTKGVRLIFQEDADYKKPAFPADREQQQQMMHLDFYSGDLEKDVRHAVSCGAELSQAQYSDDWRVMTDPAGHPFCIVRIP
jgi:catechol-2,3-dioxygenase